MDSLLRDGVTIRSCRRWMKFPSERALMETDLPFDEIGLKRCRKCKEWKPLNEFGLNSANINAGARDSKNILCKHCMREKIATYRQRLREYKAAHSLAQAMGKLSPEDRVREAITHGGHTLKEIVSITNLSKDDTCDCIAELLLYRREIYTEMSDGVRMYFILEPGTQIQRKPMMLARESRSYGVSSIYFAA